MIADGLYTKYPKPDVILGQHVMSMPAGVFGWRAGVVTSAADSLQIRLFGRGAHGSMPQASVDPVVMAASTVLRLQTTVSRGVAPTDSVVLTVVIVIQRLLMVSFLELLGLSPYNSKCRATALNGSHEIFVSIRFR